LTPVINRRFVDAGDAAGQHGDSVGGARLGLAALEVAGEYEETDDGQHDSEQYQVEDEPESPDQKLECA
jgi:hypothetical protein